MIDKLGTKRTFILVMLVILAGSLFAANHYIFTPNAENVETQLNAVNSEVSRLQGELDKMRADFAIFEKQKQFYENIRRMGFFNDQDRVIARERFDTMQKVSKIISARYEIKAANLIADETASKTGFVIMESPVTINLSAIDDLDIYRFIYYLNYGFPGHIGIDSLRIERKSKITPEILKQIGTGNPPEILSATMELNWRTMARKESIAPSSVNPETVSELQ